MNKTYIIALIGMLALLLLQGYWLNNSYNNEKRNRTVILNTLFLQSIDDEFSTRAFEKPKDPSNPKFIIKATSDMTPEERASHKGDTIILKEAQNKNIGNGFAEIFAQWIQDGILNKSPIQLSTLDSIYKNKLEEEGIHTSFQIHLYNKDQQVIDSIGTPIAISQNVITTKLKPIGTKGLFYLQAIVALPPQTILQSMLYSLIVSFLFVVILFVCLYHQLFVIRRTQQQLQTQKEAVYHSIHDLKAPLNTVYGILDYIEQEETDDKRKRFLTDGKSKVRRLSETIESMLKLAKGINKETALQKEEIDLPEMIGQIDHELKKLYPQKIYKLKIDNRLNSPTTYMNRIRLESCLRNLMENALKYSDDDMVVTVALSANNGKLTIAVGDTGWGIPKQALKKIGTPFYQVKQTGKPPRSGYGIGLSSVKQSIAELGGKFTFQSTEGVGSTFFINLPHEQTTSRV